MRDGVALSGIFHCVVIGVLVVGLPSSVDPATQTVIPIEMILLDEKEPEPKPE